MPCMTGTHVQSACFTDNIFLEKCVPDLCCGSTAIVLVRARGRDLVSTMERADEATEN